MGMFSRSGKPKAVAKPAAGPAPGPADGVRYVTEREFEAEVLRSELPVFIEFTADWCAPCRQIAPEVEAFAKETQGRVKVLKVDIDKSPTLAKQLRVQSVPTFMVFAEQRVTDAAVGVIRKKKMHEMVEPFLPRAAGALKPAELLQLLKVSAVVAFDTREVVAFNRAHLPKARNIPLEEIEGRLAELHMIQGQPVLYCRSGDKTKDLAERLAEQGMPVAFLEGGLLAWEADGFPVERP
jgi:thioredoxin 1/putative thioredoxin